MQTQVETPANSLADTQAALAKLNAIAPIIDVASLKAIPPENRIVPKHLEELGILSRRSQEELRRRSTNPLPYRLDGGRVSYVVGEVLSWLDSRASHSLKTA